MQRFTRALSLALACTLGAVIAIAGMIRGLGAGELALTALASMAVFYLVVRAIAGRAARTVVDLMAEEQTARDRRRLLGR
jgi:hypothetical protein